MQSKDVISIASIDNASGNPPSSTPTFLAFILGHFSHHLCTAAAIPLLPLIRDAFELDYFRSGLLLSAFGLTYGLVQLPMAAISDRFSKRLIVALGLVLTGFSCMAIGLAADYVQLMLAMLVMGVAGSTYHAPASAFLSQTFGKESRGRVLGIHIVGGTAGLMAAPIVALFVTNVTGNWRNAFYIMSIPILLAGVWLWLVAGAQETANRAEADKEEKESFSMLGVFRLLGVVVSVAILTQLLVGALNAYLPLFLVDKHGTPQELAGLVMSLVYGAGVVGAPVGGMISDRWGRKPAILISVLAVGPAIFLISVMPFGAAMLAIIVIYGAVQVFRLPALESLIADEVPARRRATVLGGYNLIAQQTTGIATPLFGWMMDQFGLSNGMIVLSAIALASSVGVLLVRKRV